VGRPTDLESSGVRPGDYPEDRYLLSALNAAAVYCEQCFDGFDALIISLDTPPPVHFEMSLTPIGWRLARHFVDEESAHASDAVDEKDNSTSSVVNVNESIPRTIKHLWHTRQYIHRCLSAQLPVLDPFPPPKEVFDELIRLYETWDAEQYLDLTGVRDLFTYEEACPREVLSMHAFKLDRPLFVPLVVVFAHEFGHHLSQRLSQSETNKLFDEISRIYSEAVYTGEFKSLISNHKVLIKEWLIEHLADVIGLRLCIEDDGLKFYGDGLKFEEVLDAVVLLSVIWQIVECYSLRGDTEKIAPYPPARIRLFVLLVLVFKEKVDAIKAAMMSGEDTGESMDIYFLISKLGMVRQDLLRLIETRSNEFLRPKRVR
jgi:hypothetical protein